MRLTSLPGPRPGHVLHAAHRRHIERGHRHSDAEYRVESSQGEKQANQRDQYCPISPEKALRQP